MLQTRKWLNTLTFLSWKVHLGDNNPERSFHDGQAEDFDIENIFKHPKYDGTAYYDISVLQIAPVTFTAYLRPICLPDSSLFTLDQFNNKNTSLLGLGSRDITANYSPTLKRTFLTIYENR